MKLSPIQKKLLELIDPEQYKDDIIAILLEYRDVVQVEIGKGETDKEELRGNAAYGANLIITTIQGYGRVYGK